MKKAMAIVLIVALLVSVSILPTSALTAGDLQVKFIFDKTTAGPGDPVNMTVQFTNYTTLFGATEGIQAMMLTIDLDRKYFDVVNKVGGGVYASGTSLKTITESLDKNLPGMTSGNGLDYFSAAISSTVRDYSTNTLQFKLNYEEVNSSNTKLNLTKSNGVFVTIPLKVKSDAPTGTTFPAITVQNGAGPAGGPASVSGPYAAGDPQSAYMFKNATGTFGGLIMSQTSLNITAGALNWTNALKVQEQDPNIVFGGGSWELRPAYGFEGKFAMRTLTNDSVATVTFTGSAIRLNSYKSKTQGAFVVSLDGGANWEPTVYDLDLPGRLDDFDPIDDRAFEFDFGTNGTHTIAFKSVASPTTGNKIFQFDSVYIMNENGSAGTIAQADTTNITERIRIEVPTVGIDNGGIGSTYGRVDVRSGINLYSGGGDLRLYEGSSLEIRPDFAITAGMKIVVGYYSATNQNGEFFVQVGQGWDKDVPGNVLSSKTIKALSSNPVDVATSVVTTTLTVDSDDYDNVVLVKSTKDRVSIDYIDFIF